jgi:hypothetical protein
MCRSQSLANTVFERFNSRVTNFMTPCPRLRILRGMFGTVPGCQTSHQSFLIVKAAGLPRARCVEWSVQHEDLTFGIELRLFCAVRPKIRDQNRGIYVLTNTRLMNIVVFEVALELSSGSQIGARSEPHAAAHNYRCINTLRSRLR